MSLGKYSPPERLIFDVQGLIAEIKTQYFSNEKIPLDDNDTLVHKLCVRLENILRYGAREKYSFMGSKKDYWNFFYDCLSKDEIIKFVQSIQELKTNQGKGRALLRQALMEKCLADTFQKCSINERQTKEYYITDSIFRNPSNLQTLVHSLYDLNAIDFSLPHKGYDLDRSFPSFARKTFGNESRERKESQAGVQENDPVAILSGHVINLASLVNSLYTDNTIKTGEDSLSLNDNINKIQHITANVEKLNYSFAEVTNSLKDELNKVKEEKLKTKGEYELRLKQFNERYVSLQNMDSSATEDKFKGMYDKLVATELQLTECKAKIAASSKENELLMSRLDISDEKNNSFLIERDELKDKVEKLKAEIERCMHVEHCSGSTNKILESKLSDVQKMNTDLKSKLQESENQVTSLDSQLKIRDGELDSLKKAFQQSTGYVVGSFKELKEELNNQLLEKSQDVKSMSSMNKNLLEDSKSLAIQNNELKTKIETLEEKLHIECKKRKDLEKCIQDKKQNLAVVMKHKDYLTSCMKDIWNLLQTPSSDDSEAHNENFDSTAWNQERFLARLVGLQSNFENVKRLKSQTEEELVQHKEELHKKNTECQQSETAINDLTAQTEKLNQENENLQNEIKELKDLMEDNENDQISSLTTEVNSLNGELSTKAEQFSDLEKRFVELEMKMFKLKPAYEEISSQKGTLIEEKKSLQSTIEDLTKELEKMRIDQENATSSLQSFNAKEESYRSEVKMLKKEIESLANIKNQEVQSLRFEISSAEIQYQTAANELKKLQGSYDSLLEDSNTKEHEITQLKQNVTSSNEAFQTEKEAVEREYASLQKKYGILEEKGKVTEKEITFLKVQVAKMAKEKEEERSLRINTFNKLQNTIEEKKKEDMEHKEELDQMAEDIRELKNHLINVTKDKHDLWQKKDSLEFAMRQKTEERWVKDKEAKQCSLCLTEFSLTVRKHHCRLCGNIYCNNCSNHWLKTAHSRKKLRACRACATTYHDEHGDRSFDGDSDTISVNSQYESFDQNDQSDIDSNPGNFEVLDSSSISKSGSFGPSEQIAINADTDEIKDAIIPTPIDHQTSQQSQLLDKHFDSVKGDSIPGDFDSSGGGGESAGEGNSGDGENPANLTDGDVARSENDQSAVPDTSLSDSSQVEDEREKIQLTVYAGKRCFVPLVVAGRSYELSWEFTSSPKDVGFGIAFKKTEEESNEELQTLVPFSRYMSHKNTIYGKMAIDSPGLYYLCFSNAYSRFTSKTIECFVSLSKCVIKME